VKLLPIVYVTDMERAVARLEAHGVRTIEPIIDEAFGRSFGVRDPDGTRIQVNEHDAALCT
jgi:predicted enzyme related to lactoylglutathione lyase